MIRSDRSIVVNTHEAKTGLSRLLREVERNDAIVTICRNGEPVAQLSRVEAPKPKPRKLTPINPNLKVRISPDYNPTAGIPEEYWSHR